MAKRNAKSNAAVWIIIGLLGFSLIGFGASGLSGTARSVGSVGDKSIGVQQYFTALNNIVRGTEQQVGRSLSQVDVQAFGLDQRALAALTAQRSLDQLNDDLGLSIGDENVRDQILSSGAFTGLTGEFDRVAYGDASSGRSYGLRGR